MAPVSEKLVVKQQELQLLGLGEVEEEHHDGQNYRYVAG